MSEIPEYTLRRSGRARRVRLAVRCDGSVVVTAPLGVNPSVVEKFVSGKKRWILDKLKLFDGVDAKAIRTFSREDYLKHKGRALEIINERAAFYGEIYRCSFNRICVKNQRTRWGSCSKKGNLNFNYKIIFLPEILRDYIIVHEICHLKELNHSQKFWTLVAKALPNHSELRKELRKQALLFR
ncbi:MAG: M48 family metallopeptidase [bacterium]|nr:M48 family metallopeptidase [bacterium]